MAASAGVLTIKGLEDMFAPLLQNCVNMLNMKKIHAQIVKFSLSQSNFLVTKMVDICDGNGEIQYASLLFNEIEPGIEHYGCLVDLLGRTGCLDRGLETIKTMPMKPDSAIWGSLLSSCRTHGNLDIAVVAMEHLLELEPDDTGNYVLLSNIYADLGKWEGVSKLRKLIRSKSMKKTPGCSMIEANNVVQEFVSADDSKPFSKDIYRMLELVALHQSIGDDLDETLLELEG
ncbi:hypothetical protein RJ639_041194 [Escallonia herrerae]|uniref:Pentatricopeptide repeat-containing protein n=1 Tax=Escallonia herrerae TaxID=1293975 RepID=A0AA88WHV7_9ASTE|nr:hypothetical protein RJ639_005358 [Escallonia herrerae]KAK3027039.1 hypothetical protein RJ639_041194 [Escallonia herrerae]